MGDKIHSQAMDVPSQIANLKNNGLVIEDEKFASEILNKISYYRLIKAYDKSFKDKKTGKYRKGTSFNKIVNVYNFDKELRQLLMPLLQDIEITLRCQLSNHFSVKYGVLGYLDANNFDENCLYSTLEDKMSQCIALSKESPIIKNFKEKYADGNVPFYAAVEVFTFGTLALFYNSMKTEDRKTIANMYDGVDEAYLSSWLISIGYVRNLCFHYNRLYKKVLIKKPRLYKKQDGEVNNSYLYSVLICMRYLCGNTDKWTDFVESLDKLFAYYSNDIKTSGIGCIEQGWKEKLLGHEYVNTPFDDLLKNVNVNND